MITKTGKIYKRSSFLGGITFSPIAKNVLSRALLHNNHFLGDDLARLFYTDTPTKSIYGSLTEGFIPEYGRIKNVIESVGKDSRALSPLTESTINTHKSFHNFIDWGDVLNNPSKRNLITSFLNNTYPGTGDKVIANLNSGNPSLIRNTVEGLEELGYKLSKNSLFSNIGESVADTINPGFVRSIRQPIQPSQESLWHKILRGGTFVTGNGANVLATIASGDITPYRNIISFYKNLHENAKTHKQLSDLSEKLQATKKIKNLSTKAYDFLGPIGASKNTFKAAINGESNPSGVPYIIYKKIPDTKHKEIIRDLYSKTLGNYVDTCFNDASYDVGTFAKKIRI